MASSAAVGSSFNLARLREGIKPFRLHWFSHLRSTNDQAAAMRKRGDLFAPAIVLTSRQTAGRGRGSNIWWSTGGSLTATFVLPIEAPLQPYQLPLVAGLAVRNAVAELTPQSTIQLKWPNDVICEGRKLAGLLCERIHKADLIGIGLNVNLDPSRAPKQLRSGITSLLSLTASPLDMTDVLITLSKHLHRTLCRRGERPYADFLQQYDRNHALNGRQVTVRLNAEHSSISGWCEGIDHLGRLVLRDRTKLHHVVTGHVLS